MITKYNQLCRGTPPLMMWRCTFAFALILQLIAIREASVGRFGMLLGGAETTLMLWYLHTLTKATFFFASALLIGALVERKFSQSSLLTRRWTWCVSTLHIGTLAALLILVKTLPIGFHEEMIEHVELWRYVAASITFMLWQLTAVLLIAPRMILRGMRLGVVAFVFCATVAAIILSIGNSGLIHAMRPIVEDTTLSLAMMFYALIGEAEPVLSMRDDTPLLAAPSFAILIGTPCAGYQGMLASSIIMAGLITLEWPNLRHGRALILGAATVLGVFVLNALRIALLFHIGVSYSPQMAVDGFHSYFGTLSLLLVVGMAMLAMQHRSIRKAEHSAKHSEDPTPMLRGTYWDVDAGRLIFPLALYLGLAMVLGLFNAGFDWTYPLLAVAGLYLMILWRENIACEFSNEQGVAGLAVGVAVYLLWLTLVPIDPELDALIAVKLHSVPLSLMIGWVTFRLVGFGIVAPVLEELAFRGGLMRLIGRRISPWTGQRTAAWIALMLSSLAFGVMHVDPLAGTLAGASFGLLAMRSGRIGDAIVAHAITNLLLAFTAMITGHWSLW